jgi:hypothetical protein
VGKKLARALKRMSVSEPLIEISDSAGCQECEKNEDGEDECTDPVSTHTLVFPAYKNSASKHCYNTDTVEKWVTACRAGGTVPTDPMNRAVWELPRKLRTPFENDMHDYREKVAKLERAVVSLTRELNLAKIRVRNTYNPGMGLLLLNKRHKERALYRAIEERLDDAQLNLNLQCLKKPLGIVASSDIQLDRAVF